MNAAAGPAPQAPPESVLATPELQRRPGRPAQHGLENDALLRLTDALAAAPDNLLQVLAETYHGLSRFDAAFPLFDELVDLNERLHGPDDARSLLARLEATHD